MTKSEKKKDKDTVGLWTIDEWLLHFIHFRTDHRSSESTIMTSPMEFEPVVNEIEMLTAPTSFTIWSTDYRSPTTCPLSISLTTSFQTYCKHKSKDKSKDVGKDEGKDEGKDTRKQEKEEKREKEKKKSSKAPTTVDLLSRYHALISWLVFKHLLSDVELLPMLLTS